MKEEEDGEEEEEGTEEEEEEVWISCLPLLLRRERSAAMYSECLKSIIAFNLAILRKAIHAMNGTQASP